MVALFDEAVVLSAAPFSSLGSSLPPQRESFSLRLEVAATLSPALKCSTASALSLLSAICKDRVGAVCHLAMGSAMSFWEPLSRRVRNKPAFLEMPLKMSVQAYAAGRSACAQVKIENRKCVERWKYSTFNLH